MKEEGKDEEGEREVVEGDGEGALEEVEGSGGGEEEAEGLAVKRRTAGCGLKSGRRGEKGRKAEMPEQCGAKRAHVHRHEVTVEDAHSSGDPSREVKGHVQLNSTNDGEEELLHGNQQKGTESLVEGKGHRSRRELEEAGVDACSSNQTGSGHGHTGGWGEGTGLGA